MDKKKEHKKDDKKDPKEQKIKAIMPPVQVLSAVGAGDSTVAGFILAYSQGKDLLECVRFACAAGTAAVLTPGTELCHRSAFEKILPDVIISSL